MLRGWDSRIAIRLPNLKSMVWLEWIAIPRYPGTRGSCFATWSLRKLTEKNGQKEKQTDRQKETDRQTDRKTNRQADRQTDRQTDRQRGGGGGGREGEIM